MIVPNFNNLKFTISSQSTIADKRIIPRGKKKLLPFLVKNEDLWLFVTREGYHEAVGILHYQ